MSEFIPAPARFNAGDMYPDTKGRIVVVTWVHRDGGIDYRFANEIEVRGYHCGFRNIGEIQ